MVTIRPYQETDEAGAIRLWQKAFSKSPPTDPPTLDIHRKLAVQPDLFLVAEMNSEVIGTAMGGYDGHRGWVYYVAVRPDLSRQGLGRRLMTDLEERLRRLGCVKINLQVLASNKAACMFYERLGYGVEERVSMGKRLSPAPCRARR